MRMTLMHPPLDDPTLPYHSTAYLKGQLVHNGFTDVCMRDINVEFVDYCLRRPTIEALYEEGERRFERLEEKPRLEFREQEQFYALWATNPIPPEDIRLAAEGMRDMEAFLDWPRYVANVNLLTRYFGYLGSLGHPSEFSGFKQMSRGRYSLFRLDDLFNWELTQNACCVFRRFFDEELVNDREFRETDCFGISVVYDHQLVHSLCFARLLKLKFPEKLVIMGGTAIGQYYKHIKDRQEMRRFFSVCDVLVVGEGESAICEIADAGRDIVDLDKKKRIPNTIRYNAAKDEVALPPHVHYENVRQLGRPLFEHPWDLYLSPEKGINYAPTRGCYWNRCTFCDYGLNSDMPTSPWRERTIDQVVEDLEDACLSEGIRYVYFAVDVMAPGYLERLSDAILESTLDIRWSAELRLEKIFSERRCEKMHQGGCVCVSFGMESGNQRILDLIDKGTKKEYMGQTMRNFSEAGVAVQLMAFTDFPTETEEERRETFSFIKENDEYWAMGGMGTFLLTGTSIIAKNPEKFGIEVVETETTDVARALAYRILKKPGDDGRMVLAEDSDDSFNDDGGGAFPPVLGRPWASGTDTLHSMIYYGRFGRSYFRDHPLDEIEEKGREQIDMRIDSCAVEVPGKLSPSHFDIGRFLKSRHAFKAYLKETLQVPAEPHHRRYLQWQAEQPVLERADEPGFWLTNGNKCVQVAKLAYRVLLLSSQKRMPLSEVMAPLPDKVKKPLAAHFEELEKNGFIVLIDPEDPNRRRPQKLFMESESIARYSRSLPEGRLPDAPAADAG